MERMVGKSNPPNTFIFAGANASGKSTYIAHLLEHKIIYGEYINPDLILKEELRLDETLENYLKAFEIADKKREDAIKHKRDMIIETVFSTQSKIDLVKKLKETGYNVTLFFTATESSDINVLYLKNRVENGGHDVPIKKLLDRRERGFKNIKEAIDNNLIDCIIFTDNSIIGQPPQIIKSLYKQKICFINDNFNRDITWIDKVVDRDIGIVDDVDWELVECIQIQKNIIDKNNKFKEILLKSYDDKNRILLNKRKNNDR